jgi:hypothetical protein
MDTLKDKQINWKQLETDLGLKPTTIAAMAGVTLSMWTQVKAGKRNLSPNAKFRLFMNLAEHFNFQNAKENLCEASRVVALYEKIMVEKFPVAS